MWEVVRAARTGEMRAAENCGLGLLCGVYISFFASVTSLREWYATDRFPSGHGIESGAALVLTVVFSVWATDTMALRHSTPASAERHNDLIGREF